MLNAIGRELPEHVDGYGRVIPFAGAFAAMRPVRLCLHSWSLLGAVWEPRLRIIKYLYTMSTLAKMIEESQVPKVAIARWEKALDLTRARAVLAEDPDALAEEPEAVSDAEAVFALQVPEPAAAGRPEPVPHVAAPAGQERALGS